MNDKIKSDLISAFLDNEIKSKEEQEKLKNKLENDNKLQFEFITHSFIKKTVNDNYSYNNLSQDERNKLLNKIKSQEKSKIFDFNHLLFSPKRRFAFGFFAIILILFSFLLFNSKFLETNNDFSISQIGNGNMYVQAISNFNNIVDGKTPIQFRSNSPKEIENFFKENGVNYQTHVSFYRNCKLFGAVISQYNGVKLAQHVYKNTDGKMLYVFQVDEKYFKNNNKIKITDDLLEYVDNGNSYKTYMGKLLIVMMKVNNNICAVISNLPRNELPTIYRL